MLKCDYDFSYIKIHEYDAGTLLKIPYRTKMNVKNLHPATLELIVVKAPAPKG